MVAMSCHMLNDHMTFTDIPKPFVSGLKDYKRGEWQIVGDVLKEFVW